MSAGDNIGMMEGAFFVSKGVILEWLNELLDVSEHTRNNEGHMVHVIDVWHIMMMRKHNVSYKHTFTCNTHHITTKHHLQV